MKTIGLLGGMSWESTQLYYRIINEAVRTRLGGLHSAPIVMISVEFAEIEAYQDAGEWGRAAEALAGAARRIERAGAEVLLICSNTMHKVAEDVQRAVRIPLLHIADAVAEAIAGAGMKTVGLLGTRFTMDEAFYSGRLRLQYGLRVLVPPPPDRRIVDRVIFEELCRGVVEEGSQTTFLRVIGSLADRGAEGIILGCTEIGILVSQENTGIRLFDTMALHAEAAVAFALA